MWQTERWDEMYDWSEEIQGKRQENLMCMQPEFQRKRLGQEERKWMLMAGCFFRTEERHESTDIKSKTRNQKDTWKGSYTWIHCHGTAWSTKFLQTSTEKRQFPRERWAIALTADPDSDRSKAGWQHVQDAKEKSRLLPQPAASKYKRG